MDDQFRNRLRSYDSGAPLRPRPDAPRPQPVAPPRPVPAPSPAPISAAPKPTPIVPKPVAVNPKPVETAAASAWGVSRPVVTPVAKPVTERPALQANPKSKKQKRSGKKKAVKVVVLLLILALLAAGGGAAYWFVVRPRLHKSATVSPAANDPNSSNSAAKAPAPGKLIRLVAVGDSMTYSSINQAAQKGADYDYSSMMSALAPFMTKSAIRVCSQTVPAGGAAVSGPPTFNAAPQFAKALEATGCNVIDMASANANDKGQGSIDASIANYSGHSAVLALAGTNKSAEDQKKISYFTVEGLKFAYLSFTTKSNVPPASPFSVNVYSDALADALIAEAHKSAGVVIVSMHWGTDFSQDIDATQDAIAQHLAAQNVDIILGNGPHVIEPVKVLTGTASHQTIVWFSLGNLLSSQIPVETLVGGMAVMDIDSGTQQLHNPRLMPLYMHYEWTPEQKQRQSEADLLARKNFQVLPLDLATDLMAKSQNNTTVKAQQDRVKSVVNKYFQIPLITSTEF